jgi:hypothetical protein
VNHDEGKYSREAFAGMLVRGTRKNAVAYVPEHRRIIELVEYVCARPRGEQAAQPAWRQAVPRPPPGYRRLRPPVALMVGSWWYARSAGGAACSVVMLDGGRRRATWRLPSAISGFGFPSSSLTSNAEARTRFEPANLLPLRRPCQEALKHFPETGGSIINISSTTSENPVHNSALY